MGNTVFLIITAGVGLIFTGIGIYAWKRKEPMWFWSGTKVKSSEIRDIPAYNRANGVMWLAFSMVFWASLILGFMNIKAGAIVLIAGCVVGIPFLPAVYGRIYRKFRK